MTSPIAYREHRRPGPTKRFDTTLTVPLVQQHKDALEALAKKYNVTVAQYVRNVLAYQIEAEAHE